MTFKKKIKFKIVYKINKNDYLESYLYIFFLKLYIKKNSYKIIKIRIK